MTDNLRQRRGKKSASAAPADATKSNGVGEETQPTPIEQLRNAQAKLIVSRDRTADLHAAWRGQLFRLSLIVVFVSIYQLQTSISTCIHEIKDANNATTSAAGKDEADMISGAEAIKLVFGDSFYELLGVVIASLLAYFLAISSEVALELEHWPYMLSSALVPICLGFFFNSKPIGCMMEGDQTEVDDKRHQFPVVVIYHTIVTVAYYFMKNGMKHCEDSVQLCTQSIEDFEKMEKKMELKKKLKGRQGGKKK